MSIKQIFTNIALQSIITIVFCIEKFTLAENENKSQGTYRNFFIMLHHNNFLVTGIYF
jgi:hypothetical protein